KDHAGGNCPSKLTEARGNFPQTPCALTRLFPDSQSPASARRWKLEAWKLPIEYPANGSSFFPRSRGTCSIALRVWPAAARASARAGIKYGQASRLISIVYLHTSLCFHTRPITWSSSRSLQSLTAGRSHLVEGFTLRCLQRFSLPHVATERYPWQDNSYTRGASIPVLSY